MRTFTPKPRAGLWIAPHVSHKKCGRLRGSSTGPPNPHILSVLVSYALILLLPIASVVASYDVGSTFAFLPSLLIQTTVPSSIGFILTRAAVSIVVGHATDRNEGKTFEKAEREGITKPSVGNSSNRVEELAGTVRSSPVSPRSISCSTSTCTSVISVIPFLTFLTFLSVLALSFSQSSVAVGDFLLPLVFFRWYLPRKTSYSSPIFILLLLLLIPSVSAGSGSRPLAHLLSDDDCPLVSIGLTAASLQARRKRKRKPSLEAQTKGTAATEPLTSKKKPQDEESDRQVSIQASDIKRKDSFEKPRKELEKSVPERASKKRKTPAVLALPKEVEVCETAGKDRLEEQQKDKCIIIDHGATAIWSNPALSLDAQILAAESHLQELKARKEREDRLREEALRDEKVRHELELQLRSMEQRASEQLLASGTYQYAAVHKHDDAGIGYDEQDIIIEIPESPQAYPTDSLEIFFLPSPPPHQSLSSQTSENAGAVDVSQATSYHHRADVDSYLEDTQAYSQASFLKEDTQQFTFPPYLGEETFQLTIPAAVNPFFPLPSPSGAAAAATSLSSSVLPYILAEDSNPLNFDWTFLPSLRKEQDAIKESFSIPETQTAQSTEAQPHAAVRGLPNDGTSCWLNAGLQLLFASRGILDALKIAPIDAWITIPDVEAHDTSKDIDTMEQQALHDWKHVGRLLSKVAGLYDSVAPMEDLVKALADLKAQLCVVDSTLFASGQSDSSTVVLHIMRVFLLKRLDVEASWEEWTACPQKKCLRPLETRVHNAESLQIPLEHTWTEAPLQALLQLHMQYSEKREVECRDPAFKCTRRTPFANHFTHYTRLPQYLVVQLVRAADNTTLVSTSDKFDLKVNDAVVSVEVLGSLHRSSGWEKSSSKSKKGNRIQGIDEGHYWAKVKSEGEWKTINDSIVIEGSSNSADARLVQMFLLKISDSDSIQPVNVARIKHLHEDTFLSVEQVEAIDDHEDHIVGDDFVLDASEMVYEEELEMVDEDDMSEDGDPECQQDRATASPRTRSNSSASSASNSSIRSILSSFSSSSSCSSSSFEEHGADTDERSDKPYDSSLPADDDDTRVDAFEHEDDADEDDAGEELAEVDQLLQDFQPEGDGEKVTSLSLEGLLHLEQRFSIFLNDTKKARDSIFRVPDGKAVAVQAVSRSAKYVILVRFSHAQKKSVPAWSAFINAERNDAFSWLRDQDKTVSIDNIEVIVMQRSALSNLRALGYSRRDKALPASSRPSHLQQLREEGRIKALVVTSYDQLFAYPATLQRLLLGVFDRAGAPTLPSFDIILRRPKTHRIARSSAASLLYALSPGLWPDAEQEPVDPALLLTLAKCRVKRVFMAASNVLSARNRNSHLGKRKNLVRMSRLDMYSYLQDILPLLDIKEPVGLGNTAADGKTKPKGWHHRIARFSEWNQYKVSKNRKNLIAQQDEIHRKQLIKVYGSACDASRSSLAYGCSALGAASALSRSKSTQPEAWSNLLRELEEGSLASLSLTSPDAILVLPEQAQRMLSGTWNNSKGDIELSYDVHFAGGAGSWGSVRASALYNALNIPLSETSSDAVLESIRLEMLHALVGRFALIAACRIGGAKGRNYKTTANSARHAIPGPDDFEVKIDEAGRRSYRCKWEGCTISCRDSDQRDRHFSAHVKHKEWHCEHEGCGKRFARKWEYIRHLKTHDPIEIESWKCSFCPKTFSRKDGKDRHEITHKPLSERRLFKCELCDRDFTRRDERDRHFSTTHVEHKGWHCEHEGCGQRFTQKTGLTRHLKTHDPNATKSWKCSFCPKTFSRKDIKGRHEKTHERSELTWFASNLIYEPGARECKREDVYQRYCSHPGSVSMIPAAFGTALMKYCRTQGWEIGISNIAGKKIYKDLVLADEDADQDPSQARPGTIVPKSSTPTSKGRKSKEQKASPSKKPKESPVWKNYTLYQVAQIACRARTDQTHFQAAQIATEGYKRGSVRQAPKDTIDGYLNKVDYEKYRLLPFNKNGRAYPDISFNGRNLSIIFNGKNVRISGTSASAPGLAGFLTLLNDGRLAANKTPIGFLNPLLYSGKLSGDAFQDTTIGSNPAFSQGCNYTLGFPATEGWDAASGFGAPVFQTMLEQVLALP